MVLLRSSYSTWLGRVKHLKQNESDDGDIRFSQILMMLLRRDNAEETKGESHLLESSRIFSSPFDVIDIATKFEKNDR